jgi:iron(III) transport system substrate-binding protein
MNGFGRALIAPVALMAGLTFGATALAEEPSDVVEGSKAENHLLIYSNMGTENWNPIVSGFNEKYPWITVETLNLGASEPMVRYRAEVGTGIASADMIVTGSIADWIDFADQHLAADYKSTEDANLPDWSKPFPGIYTFSTDPLVIAYNKLLLKDDLRPSAFADFAKVVPENPALFDGKIGSYGTDGFGGSINWAFIREHGDEGWAWLDAIGPSVRPGDGSGGMIEKLTRGQFTAAYFVSGPVIMPKMDSGLDKVVEWKYISDGTPLFMRGMAITGKAQHPNAAKLMLDYILSSEGQVKVSEAGFMPYREDIPADQVRFDSLSSLKEKIGADNIIMINYDRDMLAHFDEFQARWEQAMGH